MTAAAEGLDSSVNHYLPPVGEAARPQLSPEDQLAQKGKTPEQLQQEQMRGLKKEFFLTSAGGEQINWQDTLDKSLFNEVNRIAVLAESLANDPRAQESVRASHKMLKEIIGPMRQRIDAGQMAFQNPEEVHIAMAVIYQHELRVAAGLARKITNNGKQEGTLTVPQETTIKKDEVLKKGKGFGAINPRLVGLFKRIGAKIEATGEKGRTFLYADKEQKLQFTINFPQTGEAVTDAYFAATGMEGWASERSVQNLQQLEDLRLELFKSFGLDPKAEHYLAMADLDETFHSAEGGELKFGLQIQEARKRLLEGRDLIANPLTAAETLDIDLKAADMAAQNLCEATAKKVLAKEIGEEAKKLASQRTQIEQQALKLESGEARKEEVEKKLETQTRKKEALETEISRLENYVGKPKTDGGREKGLLDTARDEYETVHKIFDDAVAALTTAQQRYADGNPDNEMGLRLAEQVAIGTAIPGYLTEVSHLATEISHTTTEIKNLRNQLAAAVNPDKPAIQAQLHVSEGQLDDLKGEQTKNDANLKHVYERQAKLPDEIGGMREKLSTAQAKRDQAEVEHTKKELTVNTILHEFGQNMAGPAVAGMKADDAKERDKLIVSRKASLRKAVKKLESLGKQKTGEATEEDLRETRQNRLAAELINDDVYNEVVGEVTAPLCGQMADSRDLAKSYEAVCQAVMDTKEVTVTIPAKTPDSQPTPEKRTLTPDEMEQMFTRGEVVMMAMESFGIRADEIMVPVETINFRDNLNNARTAQNEIDRLKRERPGDWEQLIIAQEQIVETQKNASLLILGSKYETVLPYFSRNVEGTRIFVRDSIKYLAQKAATGNIYEVPVLLTETRLAAERYKTAEVPLTEYGHAEFHKKTTAATGIWEMDKAIRKRGEYPHDTFVFTTTLAGGQREIIETAFIEGKLITTIKVRRDQALWNQLPANRAVAQVAGWRQEVIDAAYDRGTGNKVVLNQFADNGFIDTRPISYADFNNLLAGLGAEGQHLYPAAVARMVMEMKPEDREKIMGAFYTTTLPTASFNCLRADNNVILEKGHLLVIDPAGKRQEFTDFIAGYTNRFRDHNNIAVGTALDLAQTTNLQNEIQQLHELVGKQLLSSIQRKSQGK